MKFVLEPGWLPIFPGSDFSFDRCEELTIERGDPLLQDKEGHLQSLKWWDYRRLHPLKATCLMAYHYSRSYGDYLGSNIDYTLRFHKGLKGKPWDAKEWKQFWRMRQQADELGVPYELYCGVAMKYFASQGWTRPPRPSHISANEDFLESLVITWDNTRLSHIQYAGDPWYSAPEWEGHEIQRHYEDYIVGELSKRGPHALAYALYGKQAIRIERAIVEFPGSIDAAQKIQTTLLSST